MALRLGYTSREFGTILQETKNQILREFPESNDFLESSIGRFFMDYWGGNADLLHFYIDRFAAESYIDKVETRGGLLSLLKLIGYQPKNPTPERVDVTFSVTAALDSDVTVPIYTRLQTANGDPWVTAKAGTILTDTISTTIPCIQGVWRSTKFTSNGGSNQKFLIQSFRLADGMIRVIVDDDVEWTIAPDNTFVGAEDDDTFFRYIYTEDRRTMVEFGDGREGLIPERGSEIDIQFFETSHVDGGVTARQISQLTDTIQGQSIAVSNAESSSGGTDFEDIETSRLRYPSAFKALRRAVTLEDWEALSRTVSGVMQAKAVDINVDPSMSHFVVKVYVIGNGGVVSTALNSAVKDELNERRVNATIFEVVSPTAVNADVDINLWVLRAFSTSNVQAAVSDAIVDFFTMTSADSSEVKLGENVPRSRLTARIQSVPGVSSITYNNPSTDIAIDTYQYAKLNNLKVVVKGVV